MKTLLLCLLSIIFISRNLNGQHEFCGNLPSTKAINSDNDKIYLDRFGNSYDLYFDDNDLQFKSSGGSRCFGLTDPYNAINIEYFELRIYNSTPPEYLPTIENVTRYFSTLIKQNNLCHTSTPDPVIIQFSGCDLENPNVVAAGSPYYKIANNTQRCGNVNYARLVSVIESTIQTGQNLIDSPIYSNPSGCIAFNTETIANIYTGTGPLPAGMTDLTNVVIHEFMHVLGFASLAASNGAISNHVSTFDLQMGLVSDYNDTGNQIADPLFPLENCTGNSACIIPALDSNMLEDLVNNNCSAGNQTIVLGDGTAPISGGPTNDQNEFLNAMSHLSYNCDNQVNNQFVMTPSVDDVRVLSSQELKILQSLGYTVNGQHDCFLIGNNEFNYDTDENTCCPNPFQDFTICLGERIVIDIEDLLCNDFTSDPNGVELIGTPTFQNKQTDGTIVRDNNLLTVTVNSIPLSNGGGSIEAHINYNISACECETLTRRFTVNIIFCDDCTDIDACDNLICNDINDYPALTGGGFGLNDIFFILNKEGLLQNSADFVTSNDNRTLHRIASSKSVRESVCFPINGGIDPGCDLEMNLDVYGIAGDKLLNIYGSEFPPCHYLDAYINEGGIPTDCDGYTYEPIVSQQISGSHTTDNLSMSNLNLPASDPTFISITNTSVRPINYITFIPEINQNGSFIILDLLDVTRNCPLENIFDVTEIDCSTFTFTPQENAILNYSWNITLDGILIENITIDQQSNGTLIEYQFDNNGKYTIHFTVTDECGKSNSSTQIIEIYCDEFNGDCFDQDNFMIDASLPFGNLFSNYLDTLGTLNINNIAVVENVDFVITSDLTIDTSVMFRNCNFYFEPNASLIDSSQLFIDNCTFSGCSDLWKGIQVKDGKKISISGGSYISDAQVAVRMGELSEIHISNTVFEKNDVAIKNTGSKIKNNGLRNNVFRGGTLVNEKQASYAIDLVNMISFEYSTSDDGILINNEALSGNESEFFDYKTSLIAEFSSITISGLKIYGGDNGSSIQLLDMLGIASIKASSISSGRTGIKVNGGLGSTILEDIIFEDINSFGLFIGESSGGIQVSSCSFENCKKGIAIRNSNFNPEFNSNISNSTFRNGSLEEVEVTLSENLKFENCLLHNFDSSTAVFDINESSQIVIDNNIINLSNDFSSNALNVRGGQRISIRNNDINGGNNTIGYGLSLHDGNQYFICGNKVENIETGISFNNCDTTTIFRQNSMIDNFIALQIGVQGIGEQAHAGNRWIGNNTLSQIVSASLFIAEDSKMPINYNDYENNSEIRSDSVDPSNLGLILFPVDNSNHEIISSCQNLDPYNDEEWDPSTFIDELSELENIDIEIYPNPCAQDLYVKVKQSHNPLLLKIYDITGRLVLQKRISGSLSNLNISNLNPGILIFAFQDSKGRAFLQRKVIKVD